MQYEGKLYGKVAGKYIELGTTEEYESWNLILQKRIAELEGDMSKAYELIRPYRTHPGLFREMTDILEDCLQAQEMRPISEGGGG